MKLPLTLRQFIVKQQSNQASGTFSSIIDDVALSCRMVAKKLRHGYIDGVMSKSDSFNKSGDEQAEMDVISNDIFISLAENNGNIAAVASEELEGLHYCENALDGKYVLIMDPLDGSGNLSINAPVSSIFSICKSPDGRKPTEEDVMEAGRDPVAAGICIYGLSTFLVLTTGDGVHGFTQDLESGTFFYTHPNIQIAKQAEELAINFSNRKFWNPAILKYVDDCFLGEAGPRGRYINTRWYASAAAELNRILIRGGVFIYPACSNGKPNGVLRKLYEAWPMAMLVEAAGGSATNGIERILDLPATTLHEKTPYVMGTTEEVELITKYHKDFGQ